MTRTMIPLALVAAAIAGCDNPADPPEAVASVEVLIASDSLRLGDLEHAVTVLKDRNGKVLSGRTVVWSSSDETVATVNAAGVITPRSAGSATITAASGGRIGVAAVTVPVPHYFLGRSTLWRAAGQRLPAVVFDDHVGEDDDRFHLRVVVTSGRLDIASDGRYEHFIEQMHYFDGAGPFPYRATDRGECRVTLDRIECASSVVVNVAFTGVFDGGHIVDVRDLVGEGVAVPYDYAQMHTAN